MPAFESYIAKSDSRIRRGWVVHFVASIAILIVPLIIIASLRVDLQWYWFLVYAAITIPFAPFVSDPVRFFRGGLNDDNASAGSFFMLSASSFVSWVFAKSILNASHLGASFGITGGAAYAAWYTAFLSTALVVYVLRTRHGFRSLPEAIYARYGATATWAFGAIVLYRLFQEVWSNIIVVASFYGSPQSSHWWIAAVLAAVIPAIYCFTGGMRASLVTDLWQAVLKVGFLIAVLIVLGVNRRTDFGTWNPAGTCALSRFTPAPSSFAECASLTGSLLSSPNTLAVPAKSTFKFSNASCSYTGLRNEMMCTAAGGEWTPAACSIQTHPACRQARGVWHPRSMTSLQGGMDLLIIGLLQGCLSYPFFDPVLTDRAFLAEPRTMLAAFTAGGVLSALFILLFSFVGIYGNSTAILAPLTVPAKYFTGVKTGDPPAVAHLFGTGVFSLVNLVFLLSSCAVLDSTFTSTAKLFGPEFLGILETGKPHTPQEATKRHTTLGRFFIIVLAVTGVIQLIADPAILDATTVSGTMVIGLGPPIFALMFIKGYRPLTFHLPFWTGIAFAVVYQIATHKCCSEQFDLSGWVIGKGHYGKLLGFNVYSLVCCWGLAALTLLENVHGAELEPHIPGRRWHAAVTRAFDKVLGRAEEEERTDDLDDKLKKVSVGDDDVLHHSAATQSLVA